MEEILAADAEGVMAPAKRMSDTRGTFGGAKGRPLHAEDREILIAALHQDLVTEAGDDAETENLGIETFGASQIRYLEAEMIEAFEFHRRASLRVSMARSGEIHEHQAGQIFAFGMAEQDWVVGRGTEPGKGPQIAASFGLSDSYGAKEIFAMKMG